MLRPRFKRENLLLLNTRFSASFMVLSNFSIWRTWPSKTDSAPVRGNDYEPGSSKFRPRANAETSHSVRYDFVVVVVSVGAVVKKFQMVRS